MARPRTAPDARPAGWPAPKAPRKLSAERLVAAALEVLQADGFDGLTMRRLAEKLGVKAASLYNHVRDKNELLALAADAICAEIPSPDPALRWREQLEAGGRAIRRVLLSHRDGAKVMAATPPAGPNRLRVIEDLLRVLVVAGFPRGDIADVSFVLSSMVIGFVLDESMGANPARGTPAQQRHAARKWFKSLPKERYPNFVRLADSFADSDADRRFALAMSALLDGLELRLKRLRPRVVG